MTEGEFKKRIQKKAVWMTVQMPTRDAFTGEPTPDVPMRLPVLTYRQVDEVLNEAIEDWIVTVTELSPETVEWFNKWFGDSP